MDLVSELSYIEWKTSFCLFFIFSEIYHLLIENDIKYEGNLRKKSRPAEKYPFSYIIAMEHSALRVPFWIKVYFVS